MVYPIKELKELSLKQKVRLLNDLWDDIASHSDELTVSDWQKKELKKRHKRYLRKPQSAIPWKQVKKEILQQDE